MLIYSTVKDSTKNKPLTVCTCWNSCLWIDLWHGWLTFWGQNLCSWVNCILRIAADVRVLTQKQIFFFLVLPVFISCWIRLQEEVLSLQPRSICSLWSRATSPSLTGIDTDSYQKSICLFLFPVCSSSSGNCRLHREVQGWEKLQMEKRKDIWESSLNNQKTDWFQTKTGVI